MHRLIGYMHSLSIYALMPEVGKYSLQPHENYNMDEKPGQLFLQNKLFLKNHINIENK